MQNSNEQMIQTAIRHLGAKRHIVLDERTARVIFRDFNPCKAVQVIATVEFDAVVNMRSMVVCHHIQDGDRIL